MQIERRFLTHDCLSQPELIVLKGLKNVQEIALEPGFKVKS